ncbi:MAG: D-glycero-beta-D-manno-heptose-7-phosphate kinase [Ginsengibacter sp.]
MNCDLKKIFDDINSVKVGIIGDVMLDTYWWGHVERISPEAPVPIVAIDKREQRIGGAGNVALNLASLGAQVSLLTVLGNDDDAVLLKKALDEHNIQQSGVYNSHSRITTNKIRIISRNQQMMRLDNEHVEDLNEIESEAFYKKIEHYILHEKPTVVILQDYNKGVLTEELIGKVIALCNKHNVITAVDPKRKNFFSYKDVTIFKPNLKEVKESLQLLSDHIDQSGLDHIHTQLSVKLNHQISLITLSEKGVFVRSENTSKIIPGHIRNVADVSGAGDTVIAVAAVIYAVCKDEKIMAEIANIAGGLVCEEVGTAIINKEILIEECLRLVK